MSIEYVKGNLLDFTSWNLICHCVNARGVMGSGVALQIKEEYPLAYEVYKKAFDDGELKLGTISFAKLNNGKMIANLCAQEDYGMGKRQLDYEALYVCLETIRDGAENALKEGRKYTIGIPYLIGCFRAGGEWSIVEAMLKFLFEKSEVKLVVVEYTGKNK